MEIQANMRQFLWGNGLRFHFSSHKSDRLTHIHWPPALSKLRIYLLALQVSCGISNLTLCSHGESIWSYQVYTHGPFFEGCPWDIACMMSQCWWPISGCPNFYTLCPVPLKHTQEMGTKTVPMVVLFDLLMVPKWVLFSAPGIGALQHWGYFCYFEVH